MVDCIHKGDHTELASRPMFEIDAESLEMFLRYARDAVNYGGNPLVEDHTVTGREDCAHLQQLKRAGLLATVTSGGHQIIHFTGAGRCLAHEHGVHVPH